MSDENDSGIEHDMVAYCAGQADAVSQLMMRAAMQAGFDTTTIMRAHVLAASVIQDQIDPESMETKLWPLMTEFYLEQSKLEEERRAAEAEAQGAMLRALLGEHAGEA